MGQARIGTICCKVTAKLLRRIGVRAVARALSVLRAMNSSQGPHTVSLLQRETGISRPALYRIMEALCDLGYVRIDEPRSNYVLTHLVRTLSVGFDEENWIYDIAVPVITSLQEEIIWPTELATYNNGAMYLRHSTRPRSPWTIDRAAIGRRLPMLGSATGRTYLAYCPEREREAIISNLTCSKHPLEGEITGRSEIQRIIEHTIKVGYGERQGGIIQETGAIAVPVYEADRILGCISITFIASLLSPSQAATKHLDQLRRASALISERLTQAAADPLLEHQ